MDYGEEVTENTPGAINDAGILCVSLGHNVKETMNSQFVVLVDVKAAVFGKG